MKTEIDIPIAIQNLSAHLGKASVQFDDWITSGDDWLDPAWLIESCYLQLLAITETLSLSEFRKDWNLFLRESDVPRNTTIVVLSGEPAFKKGANSAELRKQE